MNSGSLRSLSGFSIPEPRAFRRRLLGWFDSHMRDLPWRESTDFYRVWLSEIMLQQTRVEAVIPYYVGFLKRFPDLKTLAQAPESAVLAAWSGLGYYSRARNLQKAAQHAVTHGIPSTYEDLRGLPGIGPYTAAAVASIVLNEPHAAVDGNVIRVVSRLTNDAGEVSAQAVRARLAAEAQRLLDPRRPGDFNQALMELGAIVCVPSNPRCEECPVAVHCAGREAGRERELPVKARKSAPRDVSLNLLILLKNKEIFLLRRGDSEKRLAGFLELPETRHFPALKAQPIGSFTHRIVNDRFTVRVWRARVPRKLPVEGQWFAQDRLADVPLSTITRKALHLGNNLSPAPALVY